MLFMAERNFIEREQGTVEIERAFGGGGETQTALLLSLIHI